MCTRACPRFRNWEAEIDTHRFARERTEDEVFGIGDVLLARSTRREPRRERPGRRFRLDAAHLRPGERPHRRRARERPRGRRHRRGAPNRGWRAPAPTCSTPPSRATPTAPTCSPTPRPSRPAPSASPWWAWAAWPRHRERCRPARPARSRAASASRIGLLCSKTFDDAIFEELFEKQYGLERADIVKMNIKGVFQIWTRDGGVPRGAPQGGPRLHPRGLQELPRLRRRARRPLGGRHRRLQRLDARDRAHRPGPRDRCAR